MTHYYSADHIGEPVRRVIRQHPIMLVTNLLAGGVLGLIGSAGFILSPQIHRATGLDLALIVLIAAACFLLSIAATYVGWFSYSRTEILITDQHLIDIEQSGLFIQEASHMDLDRIQDVSVDRKGILQTLLDYGNVLIQTAGEKQSFVLYNIANPSKLAEELSFIELPVAPGSDKPAPPNIKSL